MTESILKHGWERHVDHITLDIPTAQEMIRSKTSDAIAGLTVLDDGCANTNYKVTFQHEREPLLLRIYVRDANSAKKERKLHELVKPLIPVAEIYEINESCELIPYPFAVMQFVQGELLRDVIFKNSERVISECVYDAGTYLSMLQQLKLPYGGFFDADLQINAFSEDDDYETFILHFLQDPIVQKSLGHNTLDSLQQLLSQTLHLLPGKNDANLVHGDFDPSNMLVTEVNGKWKIAAILDWEFSFSGSYLFDMGMMLRYSHKLPDYYETHFIKGIRDSGTELQSDWRKQIKLIELINLLQLIHASPAEEKPYRNRDLVRLINYTVQNFNKF